jgi:hypothetical protein
MIKFSANNSILKLFGNKRWFHYLFTVEPTILNRIQDKNLLEVAYSTLIMENKTSKQTRKNRFKELDNLTLDVAKNFNHPNILDMGVSNGITTLELHELLSSSRINFSLSATDKFYKIQVFKNNLTTIVFDSNQKISAIHVLGIFLSDILSGKYFLSKILFKILSSILKIDLNKTMEVSLFHKSFQDLIVSKSITFLEYDIFEKNGTKTYDFIRVMNLLNLGYFEKEKIEIALKNIKSLLRNGGFLLVGRTFNDINDASVYKLDDTKFTLINSINSGSEIHHLIII